MAINTWLPKSPWEEGKFPQPPRVGEGFKNGGFVTVGPIIYDEAGRMYTNTTNTTYSMGVTNTEQQLALAYIVLGLDTRELREQFGYWYRSLPKTIMSEDLYNMMISKAYELKFGKEDDQGTD